MSASHRVPIPAGLLAAAGRGPEWARWVDRLPRLVADLLDEWRLVVDGDPMHGWTALVVPVLTEDDVPAVLKVAHPGPEERHEILGLQTWASVGAVGLLRGDPQRGAMVLERAGPQDLTSIDALEACEVVAGLYGALHVAAPPRFDRLVDFVAGWTAELAAVNHALPRRVVEQAVHLGRALVTDPGSVGTLVHTDLHFENVLASRRSGGEPWLAIDPKPMSGDPHYEVAPLLWNRWPEIVASGDVRAAVRRRFHTIVDAAGLEEYRARDWVIVREAHNARWAAQDGEPDEITKHLAIAKAVQD